MAIAKKYKWFFNLLIHFLIWGAFIVSFLHLLIFHDIRYIDSDTLYFSHLYRDLTQWGGSISEWQLSTALGLFPNMALSFFLEWLTGNVSLTLTLYGIIVTLLYILGWTFIGKILLPLSSSRFSYLLPIVIASIVFLFYNHLNIIMDLSFSIHSHFGVMAIATYVIILLLLLIRNRYESFLSYHSGVLFLLSLLISASDAIFIVQVTIPIVMTLGFLFWIAKIDLKQTLLYAITIISGSIIGMFLGRVGNIDPVMSRFYSNMASPNLMGKSLELLIIYLRDCWQNSPIASITILTALAYHTFVILYSLRRASTQGAFQIEIAMISYFIIFSIFTNIATLIVIGNFIPRYMLPLTVLPVFSMTSVTYILKDKLSKTIIWAVCILIIILSLPALSRLNLLAKYSDFYPPLVECLDKEASARGLKNGVAAYSDARYITMLSKCDLKISVVTRDITPHFWISNFKWYKRFPPEFIVINVLNSAAPPSTDLNLISEKTVIDRLGIPASRFECPGRIILVYNRPKDILSDYIRSFVYPSFDTPGAQQVFFASLLPCGIKGRRLVGTSIIVDNKEKGHLTYGPYIKLPVGTYKAQIFYEAKQDDNMPIVGKWDVYFPSEGKVIKKGDLMTNQKVIDIEFDIIKAETTVEIRTFFLGRGSLTVHKLLLKRIH